jgi:hypothetical protein
MSCHSNIMIFKYFGAKQILSNHQNCIVSIFSSVQISSRVCKGLIKIFSNNCQMNPRQISKLLFIILASHIFSHAPHTHTHTHNLLHARTQSISARFRGEQGCTYQRPSMNRRRQQHVGSEWIRCKSVRGKACFTWEKPATRHTCGVP